jgi:hypothetical protein
MSIYFKGFSSFCLIKSVAYFGCNSGPTGYTLCEPAAFVGSASHLASLRDALTEQSALAH